MSKNIDNYFDEQFGFLILFTFIAGFIGDSLIHLGTIPKYLNGNAIIFNGLVPYYKSLEIGSKYYSKFLSSWILSGIFGGLACVVGVLLGQLLLYSKEMNEMNE